MLSRTTIPLFLILSTCLLSEVQGSDLKALFDSHKWFELRDAVNQPGALALYKCAVACAFGDSK
jgi:hypothetical protein